MQLCFDATRFGTGLDGAIELAAAKGIGAIEYSFAPFSLQEDEDSDSSAGKDNAVLKHIKQLSIDKNVVIACLNLDYCLTGTDKSADKNFSKMLNKIIKLAKKVGCKKIGINIKTSPDDNWLQSAEGKLTDLKANLEKHGIGLLLRLSTAKEFRNKSLKHWIATEPQDWRDLMAGCPGLALSFSPADCVWLGIDYLKILSGIVSGIEHIEAHDIEISRTMLSDSGMYGPLWWRYRLPGKGQVDWSQLIEALKLYGFAGYFSIHLDDEFVYDDYQSLEDALDNSINFLAPLIRN